MNDLKRYERLLSNKPIEYKLAGARVCILLYYHDVSLYDS